MKYLLPLLFLCACESRHEIPDIRFPPASILDPLLLKVQSMCDVEVVLDYNLFGGYDPCSQDCYRRTCKATHPEHGEVMYGDFVCLCKTGLAAEGPMYLLDGKREG